MSLKEGEPTPVGESIGILHSLQGCDWFSQDREDDTQVRLYRRNRDGYLNPTQEHFSIQAFLTAVDFYQENRDGEFLVNDAMQRPDGFVNVWTGTDSERRVVVRIKNYLVPQILEFAYLLVRNVQRDDPQIKL